MAELPPIKTAVVGVGALGEHHARIQAALPEAELVALVDIQPNRVQQLAHQFDCRPLQDYRQLIGEVQAVSLAVPTHDHARIGAELLEAGIHVLVEKPIAHDLEGADRMIEAAEKSGKVLHVGHSERFNPAVRAIDPLVKQPGFFEAHRLGVFVPRSLDIDVVLDLMIHDLDLVLHWVGEPLAEVRAVGIPILTGRVDIANARLEFANGCVANITASRVSNEKVRKLRFFQKHDYVSIDFQSQAVGMYSLIQSRNGRRIERRELEIERTEPLRGEIRAFLAAVRGHAAGWDVACTGAEGRRALAAALEVLAQIARQGKLIS